MLSSFGRVLRRWRAFRNIELLSSRSSVSFHQSVDFYMEPGSRIVIKEGALKIGYHFDGIPPYATYQGCVVALGRGATLIVGDDTFIAPGASIKVRDNATLEFKGKNLFAHNLNLICDKQITFEENTKISWNALLIDHDGHSLENSEGRIFRGLKRPLVIGKNVGIQANVTIPSGVTVGENSIIATGTVLRRDLPANCLAYTKSELKIREGRSMSSRPKIEGSREALA